MLLIVRATALSAQTPGSGTISVCQLLSDPTASDVRQVKIRGVYRVGEGIRILDPVCNKRVNHKDQSWSGAVWLEILRSTEGYDALDRARGSLTNTTNVLWATFTGRIEYCPKLVKMGGKIQWLGCGNVGDYILQIVADSVTDVELRSGSAPPAKTQ